MEERNIAKTLWNEPKEQVMARNQLPPTADDPRVGIARYYILDEQGDPAPADHMKWDQWFRQEPTARVLAYDDVPESVRVSTIFLGINLQLPGGRPARALDDDNFRRSI